MCGISGIVLPEHSKVEANDIKTMMAIVKHRGPDDEDFLIDKNIALGHVRLSIIDLTEAGRQPMSNEDGSVWIVQNGEIYNYLELRKELAQRGHRFRSNSDTEVIIHAYEEWGEGCVEKFNGMWAFAIYDKKNKKIFASRDRYGIKPFYYFYNGKIFIFSSEIKQILALTKWVPKEPNFDVIYDYFVLGFESHTDATFFKGIYQLPGGHNITLRLEPDFYFNIYQWYELPTPSKCKNILKNFKKEDEYKNYLGKLFEDSVRIRLRSDVPVGSCLSGGLDSSSIVIIANKLLRNTGTFYRQETFSWCFNRDEVEPNEFKEIDECLYAQIVVDKAGCIGNKVYPKFDDLVEEISYLIWHQDEPFGGLSVFGQWNVMKAASKKGVKVLLDGQGGDEVFLGYERYYIYVLKEYLKNGKIDVLLKEFALIPHHSKLSYSELVKYLAYFSFSGIRKRFLLKREEILKPEFRQMRFLNYIANYKNFRDYHAAELRKFQLPHLLKYEDRDSMAFSVETRLPLLDYRLVEFAFCLPIQYKIRNGWTKYIFRKAIRKELPPEIVWRKHKVGSDVPERTWISQLKPIIKDYFTKSKFVKDIFDLQNVDKLGPRLIWKIFNLELWYRKFWLNE